MSAAKEKKNICIIIQPVMKLCLYFVFEVVVTKRSRMLSFVCCVNTSAGDKFYQIFKSCCQLKCKSKNKIKEMWLVCWYNFICWFITLHLAAVARLCKYFRSWVNRIIANSENSCRATCQFLRRRESGANKIKQERCHWSNNKSTRRLRVCFCVSVNIYYSIKKTVPFCTLCAYKRTINSIIINTMTTAAAAIASACA